MPVTRLDELIRLLHTAVGPVILVSGVGLLLLSLTNRFGRAVDRSRQLIREMRETPKENRQRLDSQIHVLYRRARLIQISIIMSATSLLFVSVLVISLFLTALLHWESVMLLSLLFIGGLLSLIVSLAAFILDIRLSLRALRLEMGRDC
jgi:hypothetical protein